MKKEPYVPPLEQQHVQGRFGLWGMVIGIGLGFVFGFAGGILYIYSLTEGQRQVFYIAALWPFITGGLGAFVGLGSGLFISFIVKTIVLRRAKRAAEFERSSS